MALLNKEQILLAKDLPSRDVNVPEWGGTVRVRTMTGLERDSWEASVFEMKGKEVQAKRENYRATLLARCIVDENNNRIFSDKDVLELGRKSALALDRLAEVAHELNGISKKDQDELVKN